MGRPERLILHQWSDELETDSEADLSDRRGCPMWTAALGAMGL
jgi:hypothetical protein